MIKKLVWTHLLPFENLSYPMLGDQWGKSLRGKKVKEKRLFNSVNIFIAT